MSATFSLASARLPPRLAERLSHLREDEDARYHLEQGIREHYRELQQKKEQLASPRQQQQPSPRGSPRNGRRAVPSALQQSAAGDSIMSAASSVIEPPMQHEGKPPPLGGTNAEPWFRGTITDRVGQTAAETIEKARGHRVRDPMEVGSGGASLVRRREKGLELAGAFRCGGCSGSERERLAAVASTCGPLEGPRDVHKALPGSGAGSFQASIDRAGAAASLRDSVNVGVSGHLAAASWVGGDFVQTKIARSTMADTALLTGHRAPYVDAAERLRQLGRQRDRAAELGLPSPRALLLRAGLDASASADPWRGIRPAREEVDLERADAQGGQIDALEMQTQRMLLSNGLFRCR